MGAHAQGCRVGVVARQQRMGQSKQRIRPRLAMAALNCPGETDFVVCTGGRDVIEGARDVPQLPIDSTDSG